jgi:hypothetical protein
MIQENAAVQPEDVSLEQRVEKMEKMIRKMYEIICERPVVAPAD